VFIEPDLSTTGLLILITLVMMFLGGIKIRHILLAVALTIVLIFAAYRLELLKSYQIERFITFISSFRGQEHEQISYSLKAISAGGLFGTGLGMGTVKYYLPVSYSDFIFATIGEELGLLYTICPKAGADRFESPKEKGRKIVHHWFCLLCDDTGYDKHRG
jgi:cell division protein FtsW